jgi:hypothetical protein
MERMDATRKHTPACLVRGRMFIGAALGAGLLALTADAQARPEPIPEPTEEPDEGDSPATGQEPPDDPEDPPRLEPPKGMDCDEDDEEDSCDADHPDDKKPGNKPGPAWYRDMSYRMYELQESLEEMSSWAAGEDQNIYYYATWMKSVVQQYYALAYEPGGKPREYPYGKMTRGDYNYVYYYWVRVVYYNLLYYSADYYDAHKHEPQIPDYKRKLGKVASSYHPLVLCNYGFNGDDKGAREDLGARDHETRAGL